MTLRPLGRVPPHFLEVANPFIKYVRLDLCSTEASGTLGCGYSLTGNVVLLFQIVAFMLLLTDRHAFDCHDAIRLRDCRFRMLRSESGGYLSGFCVCAHLSGGSTIVSLSHRCPGQCRAAGDAATLHL